MTMTTTEKLREIADSLERRETLPSFAPASVDIVEGFKLLSQHCDEFDLDFSLKHKDGKNTFDFQIYLPKTADKFVHGGTVANVVNQALALLVKDRLSQELPTTADPVSCAEAAIAPLVQLEPVPF